MWKSNRISELIKRHKPALGVWMTLCDPGIAVILANAGYDWIVVLRTLAAAAYDQTADFQIASGDVVISNVTGVPAAAVTTPTYEVRPPDFLSKPVHVTRPLPSPESHTSSST